MEVSIRPQPNRGVPSPGVSPARSATPPRFTGVVDGLANAVGILDSNRLIELVSTDIIGMCLPRTAIEAGMRPPGYRLDAARETAIREFAGLIGNVFVVGWLSHLLLKAVGGKLHAYNPQGIPAKAWLNAESLHAFGTLYDQVLAQNPASPAASRRQFIDRVLHGLVSADQPLRQASLLKGVATLPLPAQAAYLTQLVTDHLPAADAQTVLKQLRLLPTDERIAHLRQALETQTRPGRLSDQARQALQDAFQLAPKGAETQLNTQRLNQRAEQLTQEALAHAKPKLERQAQQTGRPLAELEASFRQKAFMQNRLKLSLSALKHHHPAFTKHVDQLALHGNLTDTIHLTQADGTVLARNQKRATLLNELKHFLEQYVDRAHHGLEQPQRTLSADWQQTVRERLFAQSRQTGWLQRLWPQIDDGLIASTFKSKTLYTWTPLVLASMLSIGVAFYNNWLTQKKHGGQSFFPGDGLPPPSTKQAPDTANAHAPDHPTVPSPSSLYRPPTGAFAAFEQARQNAKGVLA